MEVLPQGLTIVGTDQAKKRLKKGTMLRVRLDPIDVYELSEIERLTNLDRSATIRALIKSYKKISLADRIVDAYRKRILMEKEFEAIIEQLKQTE